MFISTLAVVDLNLILICPSSFNLGHNREELKNTIKARNIRPKLVGFLANEDPAAAKYAEWTAKTCAETGVEFELRTCARNDLENKIVEANQDAGVHGIMVYYPVFGDRQVRTCYFGTAATEKKKKKYYFLQPI